MDSDDEFVISYQGVPLGVPVLTRDGQQFGILEHILDVPEEDIFEGIAVWVGGGTWADRRIQRELSRGHESAARALEAFQPHHLRFVQADKITAITVGYIRCDMDRSEVAMLEPPSGPPVIHASAFDQPQWTNQVYWTTFGNRGRGGAGPFGLPPNIPPPGW